MFASERRSDKMQTSCRVTTTQWILNGEGCVSWRRPARGRCRVKERSRLERVRGLAVAAPRRSVTREVNVVAGHERRYLSMNRAALIFLPALLVTVSCEDARQPAQSMPPALSRTPSTVLSFTNTPLLRPDGNSEPEITIAANGAMGMVGLSLGLAADRQFGTSLWTGPFGATPTFQGIIDAALQQPGRVEFGGEDADVDFGSTGTLHLTTLIFLGNPTILTGQLGVSAITCRNAAASFSAAGCQSQIIDLTQSDRPWTTSDGSRVFISYHDAGSSTLIHLQRSDDDGFTWQRVRDPIVGQGRITGDATFNNEQGPVVAGVSTHNVYDICADGG